MSTLAAKRGKNDWLHIAIKIRNKKSGNPWPWMTSLRRCRKSFLDWTEVWRRRQAATPARRWPASLPILTHWGYFRKTRRRIGGILENRGIQPASKHPSRQIMEIHRRTPDEQRYPCNKCFLNFDKPLQCFKNMIWDLRISKKRFFDLNHFHRIFLSY